MSGESVNTWRKAQHLTQPEMAMLLGISSQTISDWEREVSSPPPFLELALAELTRRLEKRRRELEEMEKPPEG